MDAVILLRKAREAGLRVSARDGRLVVEGPRRLEPLARSVLAEKPRILRALEQETDAVAWRLEAMRPQVPQAGAIPLLLARPGMSFPPGTCCSCGDPRPADRYRCPACETAAVAVLARSSTNGGQAQ